MKPFLTANWQKLVMANYEVDPEVLQTYLPAKTELDFFQGKCFVSLVGFMFCETRVLGIRIPFHVNFEEVNLRFYVKHFDGEVWKRGTVFIKEIVPKPAIVAVANSLFGEHYAVRKMSHHWHFSSEKAEISYSWKNKGKTNQIKVITESMYQPIEVGSETEFITEHYWGYTKINAQKTTEYQVEHPRWNRFKVIDYEIICDWEANYGPDFKTLHDKEPSSVFMADGSDVSVFNKRTL